MGSKADDFDVDEWQRLAVEDPQEFERRREAAIRAVIEQAPPEHQARLLPKGAVWSLKTLRAVFASSRMPESPHAAPCGLASISRRWRN